MCAYFTSFALGTLIAGEGLADGTLTWRNGKLSADAADEEVKLVRIRRANVEQLGLKLGNVAVAGVIHAHSRFYGLGHEYFLAT